LEGQIKWIDVQKQAKKWEVKLEAVKLVVEGGKEDNYVSEEG